MSECRRVMLKLSGEALAGEKKTGLSEEVILEVAGQVKAAWDEGVEIAIVIGGGNFWRGRQNQEFDRVKSDQIGMLATVMNCLCVSELFRTQGLKTAVYGAFEIPGILPIFDKDKVMNDLHNEHKIVFFAGGTGHPYFSTDTGIALRAIEIGAQSILLAKKVDGIYDSDPAKNPAAKKFDTISMAEVIGRRLQVIDQTAACLCLENKMPLAVFSLAKEGAITDALNGKIDGGSIVTVD